MMYNSNEESESRPSQDDKLRDIIPEKNKKKPSKIDNEPQAGDGEVECKICYDRSIKCIIRPCNHTICNTCSWELKNDKCPFCRSTFINIENFYM